jgi:hypothetical protein
MPSWCAQLKCRRQLVQRGLLLLIDHRLGSDAEETTRLGGSDRSRDVEEPPLVSIGARQASHRRARFRNGKLGLAAQHGRVFALYVLLYCIGRFWIEGLRIDDANVLLGLRLNEWTSILVGLGALIYLIVSAKLRPGPDDIVAEDLEIAAEELASEK